MTVSANRRAVVLVHLKVPAWWCLLRSARFVGFERRAHTWRRAAVAIALGKTAALGWIVSGV
jgi:hypothetical protein